MNETLEPNEEGCTCPTCGQFVKLYKRPINSAMALALIRIYQHFERQKVLGDLTLQSEWVHVPQLLKSRGIVDNANYMGGDVAKLVHWGLLEAMKGEREDGSTRVGYYKVTELGERFVCNEVTVPKYVYLYNQTVFGRSDGDRFPRKVVTIREALGEKFNYNKLMGKEE